MKGAEVNEQRPRVWRSTKRAMTVSTLTDDVHCADQDMVFHQDVVLHNSDKYIDNDVFCAGQDMAFYQDIVLQNSGVYLNKRSEQAYHCDGVGERRSLLIPIMLLFSLGLQPDLTKKQCTWQKLDGRTSQILVLQSQHIALPLISFPSFGWKLPTTQYA
eukprot:6458172-Amphidinium_carterae.8